MINTVYVYEFMATVVSGKLFFYEIAKNGQVINTHFVKFRSSIITNIKAYIR